MLNQVVVQEKESIFDIALYGLIALFVIIVIFMMGVNLVGGYLHPLIKSMNPNASSITAGEYSAKADNLYNGLKYALYILIGAIFALIIVKALYEKEETSVYPAGGYGGYGGY